MSLARGLVLGIDPGTRVTGYALVEEEGPARRRLVECGVVRTAAKDPLHARIRQIHESIVEIIADFEPALMAVEDVFHGRNPRTALVLGHARGAIILAASLRDIPIAEYATAQIKRAVTGTGKATKSQVGYMVQRHLGLAEPPAAADAADACATAICHLATVGRPGMGTRGAGP